MVIITYKFRIKDSSARKHLGRLALAANQVWNFCAATQREAQRRRQMGTQARWPTHFDLVKLTTGCAADLGLHSDTVAAVCGRFTVSRDSNKGIPRFRSSFGPRRNLGWVPMIPRAFRLRDGAIRHRGRTYRFWKSRPIPDDIRTGSFIEDARGRWYVTFECEVPEDRPTGNGKVGIDLGLKSLATMSGGEIVAPPQTYRRYEAKLAVAQRAGNKARVRAIHAKIEATRRDFLHKLSTRIVRENGFIAVGDVNSSKLAKTRMAKSVRDAGWHSFKNMLAYKARRHQACFIEVDERWTTQTCSSCGALPESRPKGIAGLGMRHWDCSDCGASHDRDANAAQNILRVGLERQPLAGEIPVVMGRC